MIKVNATKCVLYYCKRGFLLLLLLLQQANDCNTNGKKMEKPKRSAHTIHTCNAIRRIIKHRCKHTNCASFFISISIDFFFKNKHAITTRTHSCAYINFIFNRNTKRDQNASMRTIAIAFFFFFFLQTIHA